MKQVNNAWESASVAEMLRIAIDHHRSGRLEDAEQGYRRVLQIEPGNPDALHLLGVVMHQCGKSEAAIELIESAMHRGQATPGMLNNLGEAYFALGRLAEAESCYRRALALDPNDADLYFHLGNALKKSGRLEEAARSYYDALSLKPDSFATHNNLGNVLMDLGQYERAESSFRRAVALEPGYAEAHCNLGVLLERLGRLAEAERCYRQAQALKPEFATAHVNLGGLMQILGRPIEAVRECRQALSLKPDSAAAWSNLLLTLNYVSGLSQAGIYAEHLEFGRRFRSLVKPAPHGNSRDPDRRLRIGYVSGDFRDHPVERYIEPVLAHHDRECFDVICYCNLATADVVTKRLKSYGHGWRDVFAMTDEALEQRIRDDAIDILVDLSGHTAHNRLPMFARKPAPVQVTWLGYMNTTGLDSIDYRITDPWLSQAGLAEAYHSEQLLRLPDSYVCYRPPGECPEVAPPPSASGGPVTLAALGNLAKMSPPVIELWCRLLKRLPDARLMIAGPGMEFAKDEFVARIAGHGVARERLELRVARRMQENLALHAEMDIMLDTYPYGGGTTTCQALWMGVPVVSLAGDTSPSRLGASLLGAAGMEELVAQSPEQYLDIAADLAGNPMRLAALRAGMRQRVAGSPLMNENRFTHNLEQAYRAIWRSLCGTS